MFKFDFDTNNDKDGLETDRNQIWKPAEKINPNINLIDTLIKSLKSDDILTSYKNAQVKCVSTKFIVNQLGNSLEESDQAILTAEHSHSDLLTAQYEGGLKVWEGTQDLINYITDNSINFENKKVLDLGCGAGILGILALQSPTSVVHFQDYNSTVIKYCTILNIKLNENTNEDILSRCKFYSGDWSSFSAIVDNHKKYDIILTSETIYNVNNYSKLELVFDKCLNDHGEIYLAAKTCYFGLSGGVKSFENYLKQKNDFVSEVVWSFSEGVKREILKINRNKNK